MPIFDVTLTYRVEARTKKEAVKRVEFELTDPLDLLDAAFDEDEVFIAEWQDSGDLPDPTISVEEHHDHS